VRRVRLAGATAAALVALAGDTLAAEDSVEKTNTIDFTVPQSPAFTFLGTTPSKVAEPGTVRDLGLELANGIDASGRIQQGFALNVRPVPLFGLKVSRQDALGRSAGYALSKTQVSIGTVKTNAAAVTSGMMTTALLSPTDFALGARLSLFDFGDPWSDDGYRKKLASEMLKCAPALPPADNSAATPAPNDDQKAKCIDDAIATLRETYDTENWNAFRLDLGAASGWRLPESRLDQNVFHLGWSAWLVAAGGKELSRYLTWAFEVRDDGRRAAAGGAHGNELPLGARLFVGSSKIHALGEAVEKVRIQKQDPTQGRTDFDWSLGAEFKVTSATWVAVGLGNALEGVKDVQVVANLKWAVSSSAYFPPPTS
jgi:hypothetical protein